MAGLERILILSVAAGTGHMRAAAAIRAAVREKNPRAAVTILDTFRYTSPLLEKVLLGTYMEMLKITPVVYGYLYRQAERGQPLSGSAKQEFNRVLNKLTTPRLVQFLERERPQVIVCTHPFPAGILAKMKETRQLSTPVVVTVTDFTIHPFWVFPEVDAYLVGAKELKDSFAAYGIALDRVHATGIPIDPRFADPVDKEKIRTRLGLDPSLPVALIGGGGLGLGPVMEITKALGHDVRQCQILVIAGKNELLRTRLERLATILPHPVKIFGFVEEMHEFMAAADLMVGKAGGLTCAETLARGLPLFVTDPLPGQEERNTEFLSRAGVAIRVHEPAALVREINICLTRPERLRAMTVAAAALGRPDAARAAVKVMEQFNEEGGRC